jgi:hypothetical protein
MMPRSRIARSPTRKVEPFPAPPEDGRYNITYSCYTSDQLHIKVYFMDAISSLEVLAWITLFSNFLIPTGS